MFVTDWGEKMVKIERFNMDGTGRKIIVKTNIKSPFCITVDVKTNLVYWGDALHSKIESMTVNGTDRKVLVDRVFPQVDRIFLIKASF